MERRWTGVAVAFAAMLLAVGLWTFSAPDTTPRAPAAAPAVPGKVVEIDPEVAEVAAPPAERRKQLQMAAAPSRRPTGG
ncbi:MAG: hypothetical protein R3F59_36765 [Myxococcota bacterium]